MPDDINSDEPGIAGPAETGGEATQAVPMSELFDESAPTGPGNDTTRAMAGGDVAGVAAGRTPPAGTTAATGGGVLAPGSGAPGSGAPGPGAPARGSGRRGSSANRALIIGLVAAAVLVVGAGIALAVTAGNKTPTKAASNAPNIPLPTTTAPAGPSCPLTGLPTSGTQVPQRPALAVKVDNYPQARPQSGLDKADIVFEEPVEGGITRLVAVFQCQSPALVGPIRSARAVDVPILDQLSKPIFIHAGGIDPVIALLRGGNLIDDNVFTHASIVQSPPGRYPPYDTYVSAAAAWGLNPGDSDPPSPLFTYSSTTPTGTPVTSIHIPFAGTNNTLWTWNASRGDWLLSYGGVPATVADAGQIATANIVVQTVHVTYGPWLENDVGGLEVQSKMTGSGPLMVLRNGVAVSGTWQRASLSDPTTLTASGGSPIDLQPGPTWVEIVPSTVAVTTTGPSSSTTTTARP